MAFIPVHVDTKDLEMEIASLEAPMQPSLQIIGDVLNTRIDDLLQSEGSAGVQGRWEPFSPVTLKMHPRRQSGRLLQDTGLLASMQTEHGSDWVQVGSPAPYAAAHITGVLNNPIRNLGPIPSRDFLAIDMSSALDEAAGLIADLIVKDE